MSEWLSAPDGTMAGKRLEPRHIPEVESVDWCPLCYDPDGAHLTGTVHTYAPGCVGRDLIEDLVGRLI